MITYASLRTKMSYKYRQMSKLCIYWRKENFRQQGVVFVGGDSVSSQSKSHCFPDHKIELFLWCHRHRHASMSYVLVRRFIVRELHLIARKLLFLILELAYEIIYTLIEIGCFKHNKRSLFHKPSYYLLFKIILYIRIHIYYAQKLLKFLSSFFFANCIFKIFCFPYNH